MKKPKVLPTLTEWENALLDDCVQFGAVTWSRLEVLKVIGSKKIRELTARDPELVRRAFLVGAKYRGREQNVPMRMWHVEGCPHWRTAASQLEAERNPVRDEPIQPGAAETEPLVAAVPIQPAAGREGGRRGADHPEVQRLREQLAREQVAAVS